MAENRLTSVYFFTNVFLGEIFVKIQKAIFTAKLCILCMTFA